MLPFIQLFIGPILKIIGAIVKPLIAIGLIVVADMYLQIGITDYVIHYAQNYIESIIRNQIESITNGLI